MFILVNKVVLTFISTQDFIRKGIMFYYSSFITMIICKARTRKNLDRSAYNCIKKCNRKINIKYDLDSK